MTHSPHFPNVFFFIFFQLEIYGGEYDITDLEAGSPYFVRMFARNQRVGWGDASSTTPSSIIPREAPEAPGIVEAAAAGPHDLMVTWSGVPSSSSSMYEK